MANMKKNNTAKQTETNKNIEKVVDVKPSVPKTTVEKKTYSADTPILCMSITSGELGMEGIKSHINYKWAERGDVTEVEYQDLVAAIRSNTSYILKPYFIIQDKEFVNQYPQVKKIYESLYKINDLKDIIALPVGQMKEAIQALPDGAKESIKNIAATMINNGTLDSVKKIKALDEIFNTELMMLTELFSNS